MKEKEGERRKETTKIRKGEKENGNRHGGD